MMSKRSVRLFVLFSAFILVSVELNAQEKSQYFSIKYNKVNARTGPNLRYPVKWVYVKKGEPVEKLAEFDGWYKIRDYNQSESWINNTMLSRKRYAVIDGVAKNLLFVKPEENSTIIAEFEKGVRIELLSCQINWCKVSYRNEDSGQMSGWMKKNSLWGVSSDEIFD